MKIKASSFCSWLLNSSSLCPLFLLQRCPNHLDLAFSRSQTLINCEDHGRKALDPERRQEFNRNENKWQKFGEFGDVGMETCGSLFLVPLSFLLLEVSKLKLYTSPFNLCKKEKSENDLTFINMFSCGDNISYKNV